MLPYIEQPTLQIGSYELQAFPVLVLAAIIVQFQIALARAPKVGISRRTASTLSGWAIGLGLVGAHVFDVLFYTPGLILEDPLILLRVWSTLSSFGGMLGGLLGLFLFMRQREMSGAEMTRFVDCLIYALPFTLAVGRLGCGLQHDHPGAASTHFLAVNFPDVPRFDLGLLEFFYCAILATLFALLGRVRRPDGFFIGLFFALYGPVRFYLDSLRIVETRYYGWTPGQYLSIVAAVVGLAVLVAVLRRPPEPDSPAAA